MVEINHLLGRLKTKYSPKKGASYLASWEKRTMDVVASSVMLPFAIPLIGLLAGVKYLEDGENPFFILAPHDLSPRKVKIRSMSSDARTKEDGLLDGKPYAEYKSMSKGKDPRITKFGRFLRKSSLDEIPQIWQIFLGEISMVGPRFFETDFEQALIPKSETDDSYAKLLEIYRTQRIKPGVFGNFTLFGRGDLTLDERVKVELDYLENASFWGDIAIIARCLPISLQRKGAY